MCDIHTTEKSQKWLVDDVARQYHTDAIPYSRVCEERHFDISYLGHFVYQPCRKNYPDPCPTFMVIQNTLSQVKKRYTDSKKKNKKKNFNAC